MLQYRSYVLRVWRNRRHDRLQWSGQLEGLQDGHYLQFTDLDTLLAHLRALLESDTQTEPDTRGG